MRTALAIVVLAAAAATAGAQAQPPTGWDGVNPFRCELQQAGFEPEGPDPAADPYCVEFDKRRQNVTELGIVEFLSLEPARVGAAGDKCFYFQADHWRSSVVQDDGSTKVYEWDGHYFFDKATGDGGAWVTNFNVNGQTGDPSQVPGVPPEYAEHFGPGTGGAITRNAVEADPACAARAEAEHDRIYADRAGAAGPGGGSRGCVAVAGPRAPAPARARAAGRARPRRPRRARRPGARAPRVPALLRRRRRRAARRASPATAPASSGSDPARADGPRAHDEPLRARRPRPRRCARAAARPPRRAGGPHARDPRAPRRPGRRPQAPHPLARDPRCQTDIRPEVAEAGALGVISHP